MADFEELRVRRKEGEGWRRGKMSVPECLCHPRDERKGGKKRALPDFPEVGGVCLRIPSLVSARLPVPAAWVVLLLPPGRFFSLLPTF